MHIAQQIMKTWLTAGMPLTALDHFRPLLDYVGVDMADISKLMRHVEPIRNEERLKLDEELGGGHYSIAFDISTVFDQVSDLRLLYAQYGAAGQNT